MAGATIAVASDHAGFDLKEILKRDLQAAGHAVLDLGTNSTASVDYPDFGTAMADAIASGKAEWVPGGFASNGYGALSPGGYGLVACLVIEVVLTAGFLVVILGATDSRAPQNLAPIAIGLCLTLIHLISIPVTNTSVNPARSTGVALFVGDWALAQLWLFWLAPILGALLGAGVYRFIEGDPDSR